MNNESIFASTEDLQRLCNATQIAKQKRVLDSMAIPYHYSGSDLVVMRKHIERYYNTLDRALVTSQTGPRFSVING